MSKVTSASFLIGAFFNHYLSQNHFSNNKLFSLFVNGKFYNIPMRSKNSFMDVNAPDTKTNDSGFNRPSTLLIS